MTKKSKPKPSAETISQINAAHKAVVESSRNGLTHALTAGELLRAVKDGTDHGDWEQWLDANCHDISVRTARLYMQLSDNEKEIEKAAAKNGNAVADLSIRGARKLISKKRPGAPRTPKAQVKTRSTTDPLEDLLPSIAPGEVYAVLRRKWDNEKLNELAELLTQPDESEGGDPTDIRNTPFDRTDEQPTMENAQ